MVVKITVIVVGILVAFGLLVVGGMAALGVELEIDFSSPGPIELPPKPELQSPENSSETSAEASFRFAE